jgi:hypothetical protein
LGGWSAWPGGGAEPVEGCGEVASPGPVLVQAQDLAPSDVDEPTGDVQDAVTQPLGFEPEQSAGEARGLCPGREVRGSQGDVLAVAKLDRLSRSVLDFAQLMVRPRDLGWGLVARDESARLMVRVGSAVRYRQGGRHSVLLRRLVLIHRLGRAAIARTTMTATPGPRVL